MFVVGAALGESSVGVVGVEQVLSALVVLYVEGAERAVQLLCRDAQFLGYLCGGVAGDGVEHVVGVEGLGQQLVDVVLQADDFRRLLLEQGKVAAVLPDGREHLRCHPALELLRRLELGTEDEGVESALVDEEHKHRLHRKAPVCFLPTTYPYVAFCYIMCASMLLYSYVCLSVPQRLAHVFATEEWLPVLVGHRADMTELGVFEHHQVDVVLI